MKTCEDKISDKCIGTGDDVLFNKVSGNCVVCHTITKISAKTDKKAYFKEYYRRKGKAVCKEKYDRLIKPTTRSKKGRPKGSKNKPKI